METYTFLHEDFINMDTGSLSFSHHVAALILHTLTCICMFIKHLDKPLFSLSPQSVLASLFPSIHSC